VKQLFAPLIFLLLSSLVVISSVSTRLFELQAIWIAAGIIIIYLFKKFGWSNFLHSRIMVWGLYFFSITLLFLTYAFAPVIRNTRSWLVLGPVTFQPVEIVKVALILVYALYFSREHVLVARWKNILVSFVIFVVPAAFVLLQPDMGSALVLFGIWFGFLLVSGLPWKRILVGMAAFAVLGVIGWQYGLKDYQKERVLGLFYPEKNVLTTNYSVIQSKIAIGSAGFWGKGYGQGTQTQLGFLSEPANDFIFSAAVEEWGFLGGFLIIAAFVALMWGILRVGMYADSNFHKFICLGAAIVFGLQFLLNTGSAVAILPVVGVTFPFLSYGGSNLLTSFFLLAIIYSIKNNS